MPYICAKPHTMTTTKEMTELGRQIKKAKGKNSYYYVSKKSGVTHKMIQNVEQGLHCTAFTFIEVAKALGLKVILVKE